MPDRPKLSVVGGRSAPEPEPDTSLLDSAGEAWAKLEDGIKSGEITGFSLALFGEFPEITVQGEDLMAVAWTGHRLNCAYMDGCAGLIE